MKKTLLMAAMMVASLSASAQYEAGTFSLQPKAGFTVSMLTNMPKMADVNGKNLDAVPAVGLIAGADMEYMVTDRFSLAAGLSFMQAGSAWEDYSYKGHIMDRITTFEMKDTKVELDYLSIPVTANCYVWKGLAVKAGVQFGFLTNAKFKTTMKTSEGSTNTSTDLDEDFKDQCKKFDLSIPVGLSYEFNNHLVLDARYNIGLSKVNKDKEAGEKDSKNSVFMLTIGYKIKL